MAWINGLKGIYQRGFLLDSLELGGGLNQLGKGIGGAFSFPLVTLLFLAWTLAGWKTRKGILLFPYF